MESELQKDCDMQKCCPVGLLDSAKVTIFSRFSHSDGNFDIAKKCSSAQLKNVLNYMLKIIPDILYPLHRYNTHNTQGILETTLVNMSPLVGDNSK